MPGSSKAASETPRKSAIAPAAAATRENPLKVAQRADLGTRATGVQPVEEQPLEPGRGGERERQSFGLEALPEQRAQDDVDHHRNERERDGRSRVAERVEAAAVNLDPCLGHHADAEEAEGRGRDRGVARVELAPLQEERRDRIA